MSSTKYPCYGSVHIPGIPGAFANVIVEVDDDTHKILGIMTFDGQPVPDPTSTQPSTPEAAPAPSDRSKKPKE